MGYTGYSMEGSEFLYYLLKETLLLLDLGDRSLFDQFTVTVPRYYALSHIAEQPGISPSQLSQIMFCDKSNITRLLHGLETDGLVIRLSHETDGRTKRLYLTEAGAALYGQVSALHRRDVADRFAALSDYDTHMLKEKLIHLNRHLSMRLLDQESERVEESKINRS